MNADVVIFVHDSTRHDQQARNPFFPTNSINKNNNLIMRPWYYN